MCSVTKTQSEYMRLGGKLPIEVLELVKAYAKPRYKKSWHFKAMNTLFEVQKKNIMQDVLEIKCPECNNMLLKTRFNNHYRNAQRKYRRQSIGEIYEELNSNNPNLENNGTAYYVLKWNILHLSRNMKFIVDKQGNPIECKNTKMNCYSICGEFVVIILTIFPFLLAFLLGNVDSLPRVLFIVYATSIYHVVKLWPINFIVDWEIIQGWTLELEDI